MFIRHIFCSGLQLDSYKISLSCAKRAGGASSLKTEKWTNEMSSPIAKSFTLKILPLTPVD
jgi:hypothetical protein